MVLLLITWIAILIVFYSCGLATLKVFYSIVKTEQLTKVSYNGFDILLIGMSIVLIPLQIWSLFLPSNHYFLGICLIISIVFLLQNKKTVIEKIHSFCSSIRELSFCQLCILFLFFMLVLLGSFWIEGEFDAEFYHYPSIRWNEEYAIVPGLGNLEDRIGFNSNFLLLSSIFSLRFLFGEPVYGLQFFLFGYFILWAFVSIFRSQNRIKYIVLFFAVTMFSVLNVVKLFNTSTDILPNMIFLYLAANILLYPESIYNKRLLFYLLPFLIITLKISLAPIILLSIYLFFIQYKKKETKQAISMLVISSLIIILWLIRNVIISGYLVYPVYEIDLFSFDWKIPKEVAILQKQYICDYPILVWKQTLANPFLRVLRPIWLNLLSIGFLALIVFWLPFLLAYAYKQLVHKKNIPLIVILLSSVLTVLLGIFNGFDIRFISGALMSLLMFGGISFFSIIKVEKSSYLKYLVIALFFLTYGVWSGSFTRDRFKAVITNYKDNTQDRHISTVLLKQYPTYEYMAIMGYVSLDSIITVDSIDHKFAIYIANIAYEMNYHPLTYRVGEAHHGKLVDYECLRARGNNLSDGFRMDTICMKKNLMKVKEAMREKGY